MINELVIHLGDTKTGSTSIQRALANKAYTLPGVSISYPTINNHIGMAMTLSSKEIFDQRAAQFNQIYNVFQESNADYGIVSAEHFQFVDPKVLHGAIVSYWPDLADRLRLVAYVRPHGDKMLSALSERMKQGAKLDSVEQIFERMSDSKYLDYTPRFEAWRDTFGARFELRPFVRDHLYRGDVVPDFFKYVLSSENFEIEDIVSSNASLTIGQISLVREVHNRLNRKRGLRNNPRLKVARGMLGRIVADHIQAGGLGRDSEKVRMPTSLVKRFTERYAADAEALDAVFFDGSPMSDAMGEIHIKATDAVQSLEAADHFSPDVINTVQIFGDVLANLLAEKPEQFSQAVKSIRAKTDISA